MSEPPLPAGVREGVRQGILTALERDTEQRGARTARRLISAGLAGGVGSVGAMAIVLGHPFGHHPHWHELVFGAVWTALLVVALAMAFLQIRTPHVPIGRAAIVGLVGLGIAGACSFLCPDPHVMNWWLSTDLGAQIPAPSSALCFGLITTFFFAMIPTALCLRGLPARAPTRAWAAGILVLLLLPGLVLGSVDLPIGALIGWAGGTTVGAYAGALCSAALGPLHRSKSPAAYLNDRRAPSS